MTAQTQRRWAWPAELRARGILGINRRNADFVLPHNPRSHYPRVDDLHLADYKVRVINTQAGTAAKVRVLIDWLDVSTQKYFGSVGVSENIIEASWLAIRDAVEYKLLQETEKK